MSAADPRRGKTTPRVFTPPLAPLEPRSPETEERTLGYAVIDFAHDVLHVELVPWQQWLLVHMLELLPDGTPRFRTVIVLVARQNGKTMLSVVLALFFMFVLGRRMVLGTAQDLDTAEETWQEAVDLVEEDEVLNAMRHKTSMTNGKKYLELKTGERYKVKAANRRAGRGLSGDLILMDELREHQTWEAWGAITKTTLARALSLVLVLSNAGDATSVVLRHLRMMAHAALGDPDGLGDVLDQLGVDEEAGDAMEASDTDEDSLAIFEWSAEPGSPVSDPEAIAQANPSMGYTELSFAAIVAAIRTDPEWVARTEVLCQWPDGAVDGIFPGDTWQTTTDAASKIDLTKSRPVPCIDVSWDRSTAHIGVAGYRSDGVPHVGLVASRAGTDWVIDWLESDAAPPNAKDGVVVQAKGAPASSLIDDLKAAGFTVIEWGGSDLGAATGGFYDRVRVAGEEGSSPKDSLRHRSQPLLDVAVATAATKPAGDAWLIDRRKSLADAAPLVAVIGALWGLLHGAKPPRKSAYADDHDLVVI